MDLPGETYLFNLSILSITVAVVSALVMLVRQTMGGKLSNFDIYAGNHRLPCSYLSAWQLRSPHPDLKLANLRRAKAGTSS